MGKRLFRDALASRKGWKSMAFRETMLSADPVTERHRLSRQARIYAGAIRERAPEIGGDRVRRVLDIGCGSGEISMVLREAFPEASIVGVDRDQQALAVAQRLVEERGYSGIEYRACDAEVELPEGPFDLVLASMVLVLSRRPDRLIANTFAVIAPGGRFWARDPLPVTRDENLIYRQRLLHAFLMAAEAVNSNLCIAPKIPAMLTSAGFTSVVADREEYPLGGPTLGGQDLALNIIDAAYQARPLIANITGAADDAIEEMYREAVRAVQHEGDKVFGSHTIINHVAQKA